MEWLLVALSNNPTFDGCPLLAHMLLVPPNIRFLGQSGCPLLAQSRHDHLRESAFAVAIGGKADMAFCAAHVRF